ncbi:MAG: hypothetical protein HOM55_06115 [Proteobacteria bacterium]|nr:hypothetical protein [Pseudomonadota bacterium]
MFLAIELRQNNEILTAQLIATQAVNVHAASALDQEFLLTVGENPTTAKLWATYLANPEALHEDEWLQGAYLMTTVVRRLENIYLQRQLDTLSDEGWESRQPLFNIVNSPGYSAFLKSSASELLSSKILDYLAEFRSSQQPLTRQ